MLKKTIAVPLALALWRGGAQPVGPPAAPPRGWRE